MPQEETVNRRSRRSRTDREETVCAIGSRRRRMVSTSQTMKTEARKKKAPDAKISALAVHLGAKTPQGSPSSSPVKRAAAVSTQIVAAAKKQPASQKPPKISKKASQTVEAPKTAEASTSVAARAVATVKKPRAPRRETPRTALDISVTIAVGSADIPLYLLAKVEEFIDKECIAGICSIERGGALMRLHFQMVIRIIPQELKWLVSSLRSIWVGMIHSQLHPVTTWLQKCFVALVSTHSLEWWVTV